MPSTKSRILSRSVGALVGLVVAIFVGGAVIGYLKASGAPIDVGAISFWVIAAIALVTMTGAMVVGAAWMRSIDEAAQEAHKSAWYWGGSGGMAIGGVLLILAAAQPAASLDLSPFLGRTDPAAYAAAGAFAMLTLMLIGYGVVWAWWWLSRTRN